MKLWHKTLVTIVLVPVLVVGTYIAYLSATYIDETATTGSAYGFDVGASKLQALGKASRLRKTYPNAAIYVSYGSRAGDNFVVSPYGDPLDQLQPHDQWDLQLDGPDEFFNVVRLTFHNDKLIEIYRHRKHFELP